jgi:hypothetical protein
MIALSCHLRGSKLLAQHRILESSVATNTLSRLATKVMTVQRDRD